VTAASAAGWPGEPSDEREHGIPAGAVHQLERADTESWHAGARPVAWEVTFEASVAEDTARFGPLGLRM
jgi:hypothetical protein